jgi:predicted secreted protein
MIRTVFLIIHVTAVVLVTGCSSGTLTGGTWEKNFGKNGRDRILGLARVEDAYLVTGYSVSKRTNEDILVMKLDSSGKFRWGRRYGGKEYDRGYSITGSEYGFVVVGTTDTGSRGARDIWVLSLDREGDVVWNRVIGGFKEDYGFSVKSLGDGFIIAGTTGSFNVGGQKVWVIKLDMDGKMVWEKKYGRGRISYCYDIDVTEEGFVLTGSRLKSGSHDLLVILIDKFGQMIWERSYGSSGDEYGKSVKRVEDGFIIAGSTNSKGSGKSDAWVLRLDEKGRVLWEGTFGRAGTDSAERIAMSGENFIVAGYSSERVNTLQSEAWIFKLDKNGALLWSRLFRNASYAAGVVADNSGYFTAGSLINPVDKKKGFWAARLNKKGLIIK